MNEHQPIPVTEIVAALEREAANTDTDPRWLAAVELRRMPGWLTRTLMCRIDARPSTEGRPNTVTRTVWTKNSNSDPYCAHCGKTWDMHLCDGFSSCPTANR